MLEGGVDYHIVKFDAFALECAHYQVMRALKCSGGKTIGTESVLISHHHEFIMHILGYKTQISHHAGQKFEFLERIELIIHRRLHHERTVAVDK